MHFWAYGSLDYDYDSSSLRLMSSPSRVVHVLSYSGYQYIQRLYTLWLIHLSPRISLRNICQCKQSYLKITMKGSYGI